MNLGYRSYNSKHYYQISPEFPTPKYTSFSQVWTLLCSPFHINGGGVGVAVGNGEAVWWSSV